MLSDERVMWQRLRNRKEWTFFSVLPKADGPLAVTWWCILLLRGVLPAVFAIAMGVLVAAVQHGASLAGPLAFAGIVFVLLQVLTPIHQAVGANLGDRTAAWLYDRLTEACVGRRAWVTSKTLRSPATSPSRATSILGMTGPPLSISMDFIAGGLVEMVGGVASAAVLAGLRLVGAARARRRAGWRRTGCCARARSGTTATPKRCAARSATPTTPTALPSIRPPARSCGSSASPAGRSIDSSPAARACTSCNTPPRDCASGRCFWSVLLVVGANILVFWSLAKRGVTRQALAWARPSYSHRARSALR